MSFGALLNKTCDIQTKSETQDAFGAVSQSWSNSAANVKTRFQNVKTPTVLDGNFQVTIEDFVFFFETTVSITKADRIVVGAITYEVLAVTKDSSEHHLKVFARVRDYK